MNDLQNQINSTSKGGILELQYGQEYVEKIIIKKPITIRSVPIPATIVESSPTLKIQAKNVVLNDLNIVCNEKDGTCLWVKKNCKPKFNNVFVMGEVEGLEGEEGNWEIPRALDLSIVPNTVNRKKIIFQSPVAARIYPTDIAIVKCEPRELKSGINEIHITIDEIFKGMLISGNIIIETSSYHLKRQIPLNGNSFEKERGPAPVAEEYVWICESAQSAINPETIEVLPKGTQGEPYEFILDEKKLNCQDYNISIPNLPEGLELNKSLLIPKIEGIPKSFGDFDFEFVFDKDGREYRYPSRMSIDEKVIIPLKIGPVPDPVKVTQGEMVNIDIKIISSNSTNVSFKAIKELPKGLQLNEQTGELWGKVENHNKYTTTIEINDGTNTVRQKINLLIIPKDPLTLNIEKLYQVHQDKEFKIDLNIPDADQLSPEIKIKSQLQTR